MNLPQKQKKKKRICWEPHLSKHLYNKAKKHYLFHNHALAPIFRQVRRVKKLSQEVVEAIVYFVISHRSTQQVAYGTRKMKGPDGNYYDVSKVIRYQTNEELCRQITAMLKQKNFEKIPSRSTILKILSWMPAASSKMMKGINSTIEEGKEAFQTMAQMIKDLTSSAVDNGHYTSEQMENLMDCLSASERYLKNNFVYNLKVHSKIASHCLSHCLSDPEKKEFAVSCEGDHDETCSNCQLFPDIVQALEGLLKTLSDSNQMPEKLSYEEARYDLHNCHRKVVNVMKHLMRNQVSQSEWENLLHQKVSSRVFLTMDWAMKGLPKKYRESTKDWYGQVSIVLILAKILGSSSYSLPPLINHVHLCIL